ncbi:YsnF/AvaK domain-containing protein [Microvirga massiliensis]|uniref:YsnF/AvaK domain-containing protein n=1 Tax=Microvirga massiliensis TaxID=1033741 RepID=UPI00062B5A73|nr:YsnF/AvaK domain-containing protein [Microvirga massiliensis]
MAKTVTSLFENESRASSVVRRLEDAGISRGDICLFAGGKSDRLWDGPSGFDDATTGAASDRVANYLMRNGVPDDDARTFSEGVRRGHSLIAVRCDDDEVDRVVSILDGDDALDLDERRAAWRSEGWMGTGAASVAAAGTESGPMGSGARSGKGAMRDTTTMGAAGTSRSADERDEVIPIAEEELNVGKRAVGHGHVRIHSHVVEHPVQEQVTLREENVHVERRPVEGSMRAGMVGSDEDLFRERTIEMEERSEEPVVSKEARVKEELVLKKDVEQRQETVKDTVRRTEVEVEDERGSRTTGTGGTDRR